jgi:hypothetical protein
MRPARQFTALDLNFSDFTCAHFASCSAFRNGLCVVSSRSRVFTTWELLALSGSPRHPWGELVLIWQLSNAANHQAQIIPLPIQPAITLSLRRAA